MFDVDALVEFSIPPFLDEVRTAGALMGDAFSGSRNAPQGPRIFDSRNDASTGRSRQVADQVSMRMMTCFREGGGRGWLAGLASDEFGLDPKSHATFGLRPGRRGGVDGSSERAHR